VVLALGAHSFPKEAGMAPVHGPMCHVVQEV
jgi:hypothetical protein